MNSRRNPPRSSPDDKAGSPPSDSPTPPHQTPPDRQIESPLSKFKIDWNIAFATIAVILTIAGSAVGITLAMSGQFAEIRKDLGRLDQRLDGLETRQDGVERRLDNLGARFDDLYSLLLNRSGAPQLPAAGAGQPMAAADQATTAAAGQDGEANRAPAGQVAPAKSAPQSD